MRHGAALLLALLAVPAAAWAQGPLQARDGWIRAAPPGATVMAGYLTLVNPGATPQRCARASSADFGTVMIHRTVVAAGISRMLHDQVIEVPGGGTAHLAPGGLHMMLQQPAREMKAGARVRVTLHCSGGDVDFELAVRGHQGT